LWTLNPKPYSSYIISHCCSPASCMIGLTKWVHLSAHNTAQCGLQNPTPLQMIPLMCKWFHPWVHKSSTKWVAAWFSLCESYWSPWAHNIAQSELLQVLTLWKVVGPMGIQYCRKWIPVVLTLCKWLDPMASPCSSH
jgi:hypothetical protein